MMYAFILLTLVAALTWSIWSGIRVPDVDATGVRARIVEVYHDTRNRLTGAVKEKAREELHEAIDKNLQ